MSDTDMVAIVARELVRSRGGDVVASDEHWPEQVMRYYENCATWADYDNARSLVTDAFRDARIAIAAMREPTGRMIGAYHEAMRKHLNELSDEERMRRYKTTDRGCRLPERVKATLRYQAMVDAALSSGTRRFAPVPLPSPPNSPA